MLLLYPNYPLEFFTFWSLLGDFNFNSLKNVPEFYKFLLSNDPRCLDLYDMSNINITENSCYIYRDYWTL